MIEEHIVIPNEISHIHDCRKCRSDNVEIIANKQVVTQSGETIIKFMYKCLDCEHIYWASYKEKDLITMPLDSLSYFKENLL